MAKTLFLLLIICTVCSAGGANHDVYTCHCEECIDVKIGQMIMTGFKGTEASEEIQEAIRRYHIGGVLFFDKDLSNAMGKRNIQSAKQLAALTKKLRSYTSRPLMIAIDQEGGLVNRLKPEYGFPMTVSAAHQGKVASLDSASHWAAATAKTLADCGVNINFAPCVDVNTHSMNSIIGLRERAFSTNPDSVYLFASRWVEELHKQRITTSLKHFPGHGSSLADSHLGLVDITTTWDESELIPYQRLVKDGYRGIVMVGHLFNTNIDSEYPSSLSEKTIQGILRDKIGFEGVVATDDMNMGAIVDHYSFEKALVLTINAGANLVIIGNNAKVYEKGLAARCHGIIKAKVTNGDISVEKIDASYRKLKELTAGFL